MSRDETLWSTAYDRFGVPETLAPYPDDPVHRFLEDAAADHPTQGLVQFGGRYTYPELLADVERLATALCARGVTDGSSVATVLPTSVQFVVATNAISRAGGVHVPIDSRTDEASLVDRLERADPAVLIGHDERGELVRSLASALEIDDVILTSLDDYSAAAPVEHEPLDWAEWLPAVLGDAERAPPDLDIDVESDVHTLLFTGGTTGRPKGCLLTHRNLVANALQGVAIQSRLTESLRGSEAAVMALPMSHAYGYSTTNSLLELALDVLIVPDPGRTERIGEAIETHDPLLVFGVPTQFMDLADEELSAGVLGISGSAPLASRTKSAFERSAGGLAQGYGLSEMSPITHFDVHGMYDRLSGSTTEGGLDRPAIGVPVPDTDVKLVDVDSREEIPLERAADEGLEGELLVTGPQRMRGYLDPDAEPFDDEGYVATGDVATVDSDGRFYVVDRVTNVINVSGLTVYSEAVDEVLYDLEGVERPATVGVPDPERPGSERVRIFVEPEPGADLTEADVVDHLEGSVPAHAMPAEVTFLESIPVTDLGKVDKEALRERATTDVDGD